MCLSGQLPWMRAAFLVPTQIISCMAAGGVVKAMFPGDMESLNTTLAPGMNIAQGLFAEMFFTSYLVFVVLMLAAEKSKDTFIAPVGIGLALFVAELPGNPYLLILSPCYPVGYLDGFVELIFARRCLFHRWLLEPGTQLRVRCCCPEFSQVSLDLLAWAGPRCLRWRWVLPLCEDVPL